MGPPLRIDATDPKAIVKEVFDDDKWIKDEFAAVIGDEVLRFAEGLAAAFKLFPGLDTLSTGKDQQAAFVAGFVHGIFDDLVTSTKLLVSGKLMASGNLMRQAIEGAALAALCASRRPLIIPGKKHAISIKYWEHVKHDDKKVRSHKALAHLSQNAVALGLNATAIAELQKVHKHFHQFSHPGLMGIATRIDLGEPGPIYMGGAFDKSKLPTYKIEIEHRIGLALTLPKLIQRLVELLKS